jgi:acyl carrier protein
MHDVRSRLVECFRAVLPDLPESAIPEASMRSVATWDSLATITLVSVVQEEFGLQVEPEDLGKFVAFEPILEYVTCRVGVS